MKKLFTEGFTVLDIAEPLASFDIDKGASDVKALMQGRGLDIAGLRHHGLVVGYVRCEELHSGACGDYLREFAPEQVLDESASFQDVLRALVDSEYAFVSLFGSVGALVVRDDIQKPPVRMWLFGMITIIEMFMTRVIELRFPEESWKQRISEGRLRKAQHLLGERQRRSQSVSLIDCLQLADKAQIVLSDPEMLADAAFESKRVAKQAMRDLESLRNNLAHSQDIVSHDWEGIVMLSGRLDKIMTRI